MPRTKVKKNNSKQQDERVANLRHVLDLLQKKKKQVLDEIEEKKNLMLETYRTFANDELVSVPLKYTNRTIRDIVQSTSLETTGSVQYLSKAELLNITKPVKKERKTIQRSASFVEDEGYLTAESVNSGGRKSRTANKEARSNRVSRSLSRTNMQKASFKTPAAKQTPPDCYGTVTPKCKPNTPQILLRRPKTGEVALSMQGSPLYTATVVSEEMANINIPLPDGRLLTLQPQRGLRISQIPKFDTDTLRQLQTLRENLTKVCAAGEKF